MFSKIATPAVAVCLLSSASAAAITSRQSDYVWDVSGLSVNCADNGCSYLFNIEGPKDPEHNTPGFTAQCRAQVGPMQTTYRTCDIGLNEDGGPRPMSVEAYYNLDETNFHQSELSVQITYPDLSGGPYDITLTGVDKATYNTYKGKTDLQLFPTQTSAIA